MQWDAAMRALCQGELGLHVHFRVCKGPGARDPTGIWRWGWTRLDISLDISGGRAVRGDTTFFGAA